MTDDLEFELTGWIARCKVCGFDLAVDDPRQWIEHVDDGSHIHHIPEDEPPC